MTIKALSKINIFSKTLIKSARNAEKELKYLYRESTKAKKPYVHISLEQSEQIKIIKSRGDSKSFEHRKAVKQLRRMQGKKSFK